MRCADVHSRVPFWLESGNSDPCAHRNHAVAAPDRECLGDLSSSPCPRFWRRDLLAHTGAGRPRKGGAGANTNERLTDQWQSVAPAQEATEWPTWPCATPQH